MPCSNRQREVEEAPAVTALAAWRAAKPSRSGSGIGQTSVSIGEASSRLDSPRGQAPRQPKGTLLGSKVEQTKRDAAERRDAPDKVRDGKLARPSRVISVFGVPRSRSGTYGSRERVHRRSILARRSDTPGSRVRRVRGAKQTEVGIAGFAGFALISGRHASWVRETKSRAALPCAGASIREGRALSSRPWARIRRASHPSHQTGSVVASERRRHQQVRGRFGGVTLHESADAEQGVGADERGLRQACFGTLAAQPSVRRTSK